MTLSSRCGRRTAANLVASSNFNSISAARLPATQRCAGGQVSTLHCREMSAELTFRNQVSEHVTPPSSPRKQGPTFQSRWLWVPAFAGTTLEGRTGYVGGDCGRGGAAPSELGRLGVIGAKLRAEVLPGGRAPDFNVAIAGTERLAAEHAAARAGAREKPAAREHRGSPTHLGYLDRATRFVNPRLTGGPAALLPMRRSADPRTSSSRGASRRMRALPPPANGCNGRRHVCGKLTTPRRNLLTPVNLAVIGPRFAPPVPSDIGGGSAKCLPSTALGVRAAAHIASAAARARSHPRARR